MRQSIRVWDISVRIFHWSLVLFFIICYLSGEESETLHAYTGYIILSLIVYRILWGFIGTRHARFADFIYPPKQVIGYLTSLYRGKPKHYLGHNPAGGWMTVLLLSLLLLTTWSGLEAYADEGKGPLASITGLLIPAVMANGDNHDADSDEFWEDIHESLSNLTLFAVFIHILGVFVSSRLHRENLVRAMITGRKTIDPDD